MRRAFLLLLLANAVLAAYLYSAPAARREAGSPAQLEMNADQVRLLGPAAPESAPPSKSAPAPAACLEWGPFAGPIRALAAQTLRQQGLTEAVSPDTRKGPGYWAYVPPLKSRAEAEQKAAELKKRGAGELFLIQDDSHWRNAISLGMFSTEAAAKAYVEELRKKGIRSAVAGRRDEGKPTALFIRDPGEAAAEKLAALKSAFPDAELKAGGCPPP